MMTAVFIDDCSAARSPLLAVPGTQQLGLVESKLHKDARGYALYHLDEDVVEREANAKGIEALIGPAGSVCFMHPNVLHGSSNNVSPWPRAIMYLIYNAVSNACVRSSDPGTRTIAISIPSTRTTMTRCARWLDHSADEDRRHRQRLDRQPACRARQPTRRLLLGGNLRCGCRPQASRRRAQRPFYEDLETLLERESPEGAIIATPNDSHAAIARGVRPTISPRAHREADCRHDRRRQRHHPGGRRGPQPGLGWSSPSPQSSHHPHSLDRSRRCPGSARRGFRVVGFAQTGRLLSAGWRRTPPGGGPTVINLIHELDSLRYICGEITHVFAQASSAVREFEVEDTLSIALSFEDGALGSVLASDAAAAPWSYEATTAENPYYFHIDENCYHFLGTKGSLAFPRMELWQYADVEKAGWQHPIRRTTESVEPADPLEAQLEHFCRVIRGEELPIVDARDATRSLAVALAVLESSRDQAPVALSVSPASTE